MPKYAHQTFEGGGVAIWQITESSDELYALLATDKYDQQLAGKHHEARRAEWLAVRVLVKDLLGTEVEVAYHPTGRPYLKGSDVSISISHTKGFAAVAYRHGGAVGMDIEYVSPRVERIASRFTSQEEAAYIDGHNANGRQGYHLVNWSAKEALYKLYDSPSMAEFKEVFRIAPYRLSSYGTLHATIHAGAEEHTALVSYRIFSDFVCTWALRLSDAMTSPCM